MAEACIPDPCDLSFRKMTLVDRTFNGSKTFKISETQMKTSKYVILLFLLFMTVIAFFYRSGLYSVVMTPYLHDIVLTPPIVTVTEKSIVLTHPMVTVAENSTPSVGWIANDSNDDWDTEDELMIVNEGYHVVKETSRKPQLLPWNTHPSCSNNTSQHTENGEKGLKILLMTEYRSGSSFTGEIFQKNPDILYLFEPLKLMMLNTTPSNYDGYMESLQQEYITILNDVFNCNFTSLLQYSQQYFGYDISKYLHRVWMFRIFKDLFRKMGVTDLKAYTSSSINYIKNITNPDAMSRVCETFRHRCIKVIRSKQIEDSVTLLDRSKVNETSIRILYLVRDPRAIASSRIKVKQIKTNISDIKTFLANHQGFYKEQCFEFQTNINSLRSLYFSEKCTALNKYFRIFRFEDLAAHSVAMIQEIYNFLGLPVHPNVLHYIEENGKAPTSNKTNQLEKDSMYSTRKNSAAIAEAWRSHLPYQYAQKIDTFCAQVLTELGYRRLDNGHNMENASISFVDNLTVPSDISIHVL